MGHRDTENADKILGHRDTKNADRLGHRDIKNVENLGHRDTENADKMLITKPCWDTGTLKMQTGWDTRT